MFNLGDEVGYIHDPYDGRGTIVGIVGANAQCHEMRALVEVSKGQMFWIRLSHLRTKGKDDEQGGAQGPTRSRSPELV